MVQIIDKSVLSSYTFTYDGKEARGSCNYEQKPLGQPNNQIPKHLCTCLQGAFLFQVQPIKIVLAKGVKLMDSSMIGKIEKAMFYAHEPERVTFEDFVAEVQGDHKQHNVTYDQGSWTCDCKFYQCYGVCSHIMALERILSGSVKTAEAHYIMDSNIIRKIEKAIIYAHERERITFASFRATIQGDHKKHEIGYNRGVWTCDCGYFFSRGVCSHVMALERMLIDSVKTAEAIPVPA